MTESAPSMYGTVQTIDCGKVQFPLDFDAVFKQTADGKLGDVSQSFNARHRCLF
jgi:hypothetical protein